jgi:beta-lactamase regulating signal transducer with metallopeptidase domain
MWVLLHTATVLLLAIIVLIVCRWSRLDPAARHALWLLVLLKLLVPPFVAWPWPLPILPDARHQTRAATDEEMPLVGLLDRGEWDAASADRQTEPSEVVPDDMALSLIGIDRTPVVTERAGFHWDRLLDAAVLVWLCGGLVVAFVQIRRLMQFRRWLAHTGPVSPRLASQVKKLADLLSVRPPRLAVLPGLGSPLVWAGGRARLLWPAGLEDDLSPEGCRAVLAHELAHLARRDHLVGWLILAAGCVWWWHPLFYLIRRRLHREAELACDGRVVAALPDARRSYAEALLDVCQRQSWTAAATPMLGASGRSRDLERRLVMIMRANVPGRLSLRVLAAIGLLGLIVLPAWTLGQVNTAAKDAKTAPVERDKQLQNLEHKLQETLKEVETQRKISPSLSYEVPIQAAETLYALNFVDSGTVETMNRDKKIQELEAKLKTLLKEVQSLRASGRPITQPATEFFHSGMLKYVAESQGSSSGPATPAEIALSRTTYKLPAEKAEALGKFLQQHVKGVIMEVKVESENLIVTTTPQVQQGIRQFIALTEGKMPQSKTNVPLHLDQLAK